MKKSIQWFTDIKPRPNGRILIVSVNSSDGRCFADIAKPDELGWMDIHGDIHLYHDCIVAWAELPEPLIIKI